MVRMIVGRARARAIGLRADDHAPNGVFARRRLGWNIGVQSLQTEPHVKGDEVMTRRVRVAAQIGVATLAIGLYAGSGGAAPKQPRIETGPDAEITHDGLVRVDKSVVDAAWVKPTFDLTPYTKLMVVSEGVAFRKLDPVSEFQARNETQFPVKEENKERLS